MAIISLSFERMACYFKLPSLKIQVNKFQKNSFHVEIPHTFFTDGSFLYMPCNFL